MKLDGTRLIAACAIALLLGAGCAAGVSLDDITNIFGKQKKFYDAAKESQNRGRYYDAALNAMEALKIKQDYADAKILLRDVAPRAYQERLAIAQDAERSSPERAIVEYQTLRAFTDQLVQLGVSFQTVDYASKQRDLELRIREIKNVDAEKAYAEAEGLFQRGRYEDAITSYGRVLAMVPNYKDAKHKSAECHYQLAVADVKRQQYRKAAERFKEADSYSPGLKDSRAKAARIHASLGQHFLNAGYPRNAIQEFQEADRLMPNLPDVAAGLRVARERAVKRAAVVGVTNRTGKNIEGMSVEDFIADEIFDQLQQKKSQFIEVYARAQLDAILGEQQLGLEAIVDKATAPELGKIKGVNYILVGKITQVSQTRRDPTARRKETSYQVPVYQQVTQYGKGGRPYTVQRQVGTRTQSVQYDEVQWATEIAFAGSISLFDVETAKVAVSRNFNKRESGSGRWAESLSIPEAQNELSDEVKALFKASKTVLSADVMAKNVIKGLVEELVSAVLTAVDRTPSVADPVGALAGL